MISVQLSQLDLENKSCKYVNITYIDPHYPNVTRNALVIRGPSKASRISNSIDNLIVMLPWGWLPVDAVICGK